MNHFLTVKAALDATFAAICNYARVQPNQAHQLIATYLAAMSDAWRCGADPNLAYHDPFVRFAYLYGHTAANANLCEVAVRSSPDICHLILNRCDHQEELRICAFGGGPGTELMAICKHLIRERAGRPPVRVEFTLLDRVVEWSESLNVLETAINATMREQFGNFVRWPVIIGRDFIPFDMTNVGQYANLAQLFGHDIHIMSYVVSEIFGNAAALQGLLVRMVEAARPGAKFLLIDRHEDRWVNTGYQLLQNSGLAVSQPVFSAENMDGDERCNVLVPYVDHIAWRPRVRWRNPMTGRGAFWIVGTRQ